MRLAATGRVRSARAARAARAAGSRSRDSRRSGTDTNIRSIVPSGCAAGQCDGPTRRAVVGARRPRPATSPAPAGTVPVWLSGDMDYRTLGTTGVQVSRLCLGAMMFGAWGNPDHDDSIRIIHRAVDAGINFIDTADMYSFGESEVIVGKALAEPRPRAHRARHQGARADVGEDPNAQGNSRRWVIAECEHSLRRLGTDYIDLYQIHRPVARDRHRRHARRAQRPGPRGQDPLRRLLDLPGPPGGRVPLGGRAAGPRALPDRAAPVLDPGPRASRPTCCRSASSTGWACSAGARWPGAGCRGRSARGRRTPPGARRCFPDRYDLSTAREPGKLAAVVELAEGGRRGRPSLCSSSPWPSCWRIPPSPVHHRAPHHGPARVPAGHAPTSRSATTCSTASTRSPRRGRTSAARTRAGNRPR